jgi:hypothetical protein
VWQPEKKSGAETQGILYIGSAVWQLRANPISLEDPDTEMARETEVDTTTHLKS